MSRWKKDEATEGALYNREWATTDKGKAYKERHKEYAKEWRKNNREKFKATQKAGNYRTRLEALQQYSGLDVPECKCCGETGFPFLTIDHIDGNGAKHRRELGMTQGDSAQMERKGRKGSMGGTGFVYWLKKNNWPPGFQVLCANCNFAKRSGQECPHEQLRRDQLKKQLLSIGGESMFGDQLDYDPDAKLILAGKLFEESRQFMVMEPHRCHWNVARLYEDGVIDQIVIGYALNHENVWFQHTWGMREGTLVETSEINFVGIQKYFGVVHKEPTIFVEMCRSNPPGSGKVRIAKYLNGTMVT